ncbi:hypothetical protein EVAR_9461_1 [Eumeta japonica]|uniref:Uncharacterized protein n=1 Tax=Eumeta variegata TaxID=151549 RepID=A0A4C1UCZ8_EUMVA|nr:hypothetical protein EVAR_9461_1 [Eumeta japonica]
MSSSELEVVFPSHLLTSSFALAMSGTHPWREYCRKFHAEGASDSPAATFHQPADEHSTGKDERTWSCRRSRKAARGTEAPASDESHSRTF